MPVPAFHHTTPAAAPTTAKLRAFHRRLRAWYRAHGRRHLPWRRTADPYAVYVSEIMLQQTRAATVLERYYHPFLRRFPTLAAVAAAPLATVLKTWQGMGYYNRAVSLHKAAVQCRGRLPQTVEGLMELPGVGRNTAHAVAAFAFHRPVPVLEANVKRVLARLFALKNPDEKRLWEQAAALLDTASPFDYNQAMMDLGALVCTARAPRCAECPARAICRGKSNPESYPARKARPRLPVRRRLIVVRRSADNRYFAAPRATRFLNGMYHFAEYEERAAPGNGRHLGHVRHDYSHFRLEAEVYVQDTGRRAKGKNWHTLEELQRLPHSRTEAKIISMLAE